MGYAVGSACFESLAEAGDAFYSNVSPVLTADGYRVFEREMGVWKLSTYGRNGDALQLVDSVVAVRAFPECSNAESLADGLQLGWLTLTPMLAVMGLMYLRKVLT